MVRETHDKIDFMRSQLDFNEGQVLQWHQELEQRVYIDTSSVDINTSWAEEMTKHVEMVMSAASSTDSAFNSRNSVKLRSAAGTLFVICTNYVPAILFASFPVSEWIFHLSRPPVESRYPDQSGVFAIEQVPDRHTLRHDSYCQSKGTPQNQ